MMKCALLQGHCVVTPHTVSPCCNYYFHTDHTVSEYWHSDLRHQLINQLAQDQWPEGCGQCRSDEQAGRSSLRQWANSEFADQPPESDQPHYVDLRLSNRCNLKCRMCDPRYSAGIAAEMHRHDLHEFYPTASQSHKLQTISDHRLEDIKMMLPKIDRLMFTGGEPTQIDQVRDIIDLSIRTGHSHTCDLLITTNATHCDAWWLQLSQHFRSMHWTISMDGVGKTYEYIRSGAEWSQFAHTVEDIIHHASSVQINSVMSALTVHDCDRAVEMVQQWRDQHRSVWPRGHFDWTMPVLHEPAQLRCWVYPRRHRSELIKRLESVADVTRSVGFEAVGHSARSVIAELSDQPDQPELWLKFRNFMQRLDQIRRCDQRMPWHEWFDDHNQ